MCLIAFAWKVHPRAPLVVAANRDEWRERPTDPLAPWPEPPGVFAGRDRSAGGTWLGLGPNRRFAALTNVREPSRPVPGAPSRGGLVLDFLRSATAPLDHLQALATHASAYQGFNLLVGDDDTLGYFGSLRGEVLSVPPGVHGLSNHRLDEPWPKVRRATEALTLAIQEPVLDLEALFALLADDRPAADAELPDTGVGLELERRLAPVLLTGPGYGTRCSTVVIHHDDGRREIRERTRDAHGAVTHDVSFSPSAPAAS